MQKKHPDPANTADPLDKYNVVWHLPSLSSGDFKQTLRLGHKDATIKRRVE